MLYRRIIIRPFDGSSSIEFHPGAPHRQCRLWVHILLFLITLLTTTTVGALMEGNDPISGVRGFASGFPFSLTILTILGVHEFAHYMAGKKWGIEVTLPYFIPAPFPPIGTFGAVIRMRSSIPNRRALVDVGAAGPIAGFVLSIAACVIGLGMSQVVPLQGAADSAISLGESVLFKLLSLIVIGPVGKNQDVLLHPIAFAGWIGLFVTALNLMPFGQLDGGHVLFALSPKLHDLFRRLRVPLLLFMGMVFWSGWYVWAVLLIFIGGVHPYPDYMERKLDPVRIAISLISLAVFIVCIMPAPVKG